MLLNHPQIGTNLEDHRGKTALHIVAAAGFGAVTEVLADLSGVNVST